MSTRTTAAALALWLVTAGSAAAPSSPLNFDLRGYADLGLAVTDTRVGWTDGGVGKLRYGADSAGERDVSPVFSEAMLIGTGSWGRAWRARLALKFDDEQRHAVDIAEAYVAYRGPPRPAVRWRARAGTFLPPFSLENHAIGWTSPYTLSSSALNAWIGEELRVNGGEAKAIVPWRGTEIDLYAAVYFANDAAGKLLASRGFAIHDRELALFDRAPLPTLHATLKNPRGPFAPQANHFEPLHEIDGRPGYYVGVNVRTPNLGRFMAAYYDNNGDPAALNRTEGQYAWDTRFGVLGYRGEVRDGLTFVTQAMYGETLMGAPLPWTGKRASETTFFTAYGLLAAVRGRLGVALRGEVFEQWDRDRMLGHYDGSEDGYGVTLNTSWRLHRHVKLAAELLYVEHSRPVRTLVGHPRSLGELGLRLNARLLF